MSVISSKRIRRGLIVDLFAGGGGASTGIEAALGRPVDIAINHDRIAIAVHLANHHRTVHYTTDIWDVSPRKATCGQPVMLLHGSPDCKHFSRAKGGKPKSKKVRSLAWVMRRWAKDCIGTDGKPGPDCMTMENVAEFVDWGPLYDSDTWRKKDSDKLAHGPKCPGCSWKRPTPEQRKKTTKHPKSCSWNDVGDAPIPELKGTTFKRWLRDLERFGYVVEYRQLKACDFGAPTSRKRLFLVARRDGKPIVWPKPTHGPGLIPFNTAAQCIDWSIPCPSIFERERPLAEKTLKRIAAGIMKFVIDNPTPFIVQVNHGGDNRRPNGITEPLPTITATQRSHALVTPFVAGCGGRAGQTPPTAGDAPMGTITTKNDRVLVTPVIATIDNASSAGTPQSADEPLGTVIATNQRHAVVAPTLVQTGYGERQGQDPRALDLHKPLGTLMAQGQKHALVTSFLAQHYEGQIGKPLTGPIPTITAIDHHSLVTSNLVTFRGTAPNQPMAAPVDAPLGTISAGGIHAGEVRSFLTVYYGSTQDVGQDVRDPLRTVVTKDRFGLVTIAGVDYQITDIGMRMLEPHELLAAQFGRFAAGYDMTPAKTKKDAVRLIGNSVCPELEEALIAANFPEEAARARTRAAA